ncbi:hypothetical protein B0H14DRAFT_3155580 [Mycena olivaceomarginata]|nr:hypothetical protein B0H14DRAFT_3155580 [Mycena olivaceomarginata]
MGPELRELQTSCDRGEISENEREKDARVLADLWACELEDQRVRAEGYVWNEELGEYFHPDDVHPSFEEEDVTYPSFEQQSVGVDTQQPLADIYRTFPDADPLPTAAVYVYPPFRSYTPRRSYLTSLATRARPKQTTRSQKPILAEHRSAPRGPRYRSLRAPQPRASQKRSHDSPPHLSRTPDPAPAPVLESDPPTAARSREATTISVVSLSVHLPMEPIPPDAKTTENSAASRPANPPAPKPPLKPDDKPSSFESLGHGSDQDRPMSDSEDDNSDRRTPQIDEQYTQNHDDNPESQYNGGQGIKYIFQIQPLAPVPKPGEKRRKNATRPAPIRKTIHLHEDSTFADVLDTALCVTKYDKILPFKIVANSLRTKAFTATWTIGRTDYKDMELATVDDFDEMIKEAIEKAKPTVKILITQIPSESEASAAVEEEPDKGAPKRQKTAEEESMADTIVQLQTTHRCNDNQCSSRFCFLGNPSGTHVRLTPLHFSTWAAAILAETPEVDLSNPPPLENKLFMPSVTSATDDIALLASRRLNNKSASPPSITVNNDFSGFAALLQPLFPASRPAPTTAATPSSGSSLAPHSPSKRTRMSMSDFCTAFELSAEIQIRIMPLELTGPHLLAFIENSTASVVPNTCSSSWTPHANANPMTLRSASPSSVSASRVWWSPSHNLAGIRDPVILIAGTIAGWYFPVSRLSKTKSPADPTSNTTSNTTSGDGQPSQQTLGNTSTAIFIHVVFSVVTLVQGLFIERHIFRLRAERYSYLHPGEILPSTRRRAMMDTSLGFSPWNRPPLPTYARRFGPEQRRHRRCRRLPYRCAPPPAYGNTRGSTFLLSGFLHESLRAQKPVFSTQTTASQNTSNTPMREHSGRPISYRSVDEEQEVGSPLSSPGMGSAGRHWRRGSRSEEGGEKEAAEMEGVLPHAEENEKVKEGAKRDKVIEMGQEEQHWEGDSQSSALAPPTVPNANTRSPTPTSTIAHCAQHTLLPSARSPCPRRLSHSPHSQLPNIFARTTFLRCSRSRSSIAHFSSRSVGVDGGARLLMGYTTAISGRIKCARLSTRAASASIPPVAPPLLLLPPAVDPFPPVALAPLAPLPAALPPKTGLKRPHAPAPLRRGHGAGHGHAPELDLGLSLGLRLGWVRPTSRWACPCRPTGRCCMWCAVLRSQRAAAAGGGGGAGAYASFGVAYTVSSSPSAFTNTFTPGCLRPPPPAPRTRTTSNIRSTHSSSTHHRPQREHALVDACEAEEQTRGGAVGGRVGAAAGEGGACAVGACTRGRERGREREGGVWWWGVRTGGGSGSGRGRGSGSRAPGGGRDVDEMGE